MGTIWGLKIKIVSKKHDKLKNVKRKKCNKIKGCDNLQKVTKRINSDL